MATPAGIFRRSMRTHTIEEFAKIMTDVENMDEGKIKEFVLKMHKRIRKEIKGLARMKEYIRLASDIENQKRA